MVDVRDKLNTTKPTASSWVSQFIYGEFGAGKTKYAGTAADCELTRPCLILDSEGGMTTLAGVDVDVEQVRTSKRLKEIYETLYTQNNGYYKCCVLDSTSEFQKLDMMEIMKAVMLKDATRDPDVPSQKEYLKSLVHMRTITRAFKDLPMHTIFTSHSREKQDDRTNITKVLLSLPGQQAMEVPGFVDVVGYLFVDEKGGKSVRKLQTQKTKRVYAKDRFNILGDEVFGLTENPTVSLVMEKIRSVHKG